MKYKTFRNIVFAGLLTFSASLGWYLYYEDELSPTVKWEQPSAEVQAPEVENPAVAGAVEGQRADAGLVSGSGAGQGAAVVADGRQAGAPVSGPGLRSLDQAILDRVGSPASTDKVKDAFPGAIKVNLYHDDKSGWFNRLKIDLDRDEKWDEKWTLAGGKVLKRQVAPADDEVYTEAYVLEGQTWVRQE